MSLSIISVIDWEIRRNAVIEDCIDSQITQPFTKTFDQFGQFRGEQCGGVDRFIPDDVIVHRNAGLQGNHISQIDVFERNLHESKSHVVIRGTGTKIQRRSQEEREGSKIGAFPILGLGAIEKQTTFHFT